MTENLEPEQQNDQRIQNCAGIGAAIGVAMDNLALGMGIGLVCGAAFGATSRVRSR